MFQKIACVCLKRNAIASIIHHEAFHSGVNYTSYHNGVKHAYLTTLMTQKSLCTSNVFVICGKFRVHGS